MRSLISGGVSVVSSRCHQWGLSLALAVGWDPFPIARFLVSKKTGRRIINLLLYSCLTWLHSLHISEKYVYRVVGVVFLIWREWMRELQKGRQACLMLKL